MQSFIIDEINIFGIKTPPKNVDITTKTKTEHVMKYDKELKHFEISKVIVHILEDASNHPVIVIKWGD